MSFLVVIIMVTVSSQFAATGNYIYLSDHKEQKSKENSCIVGCKQNVSYGSGFGSSLPFLAVVVLASTMPLVLFAFYKTKKNETFSVRCKKCGLFTGGLKCSYCNSR